MADIWAVPPPGPGAGFSPVVVLLVFAYLIVSPGAPSLAKSGNGHGQGQGNGHGNGPRGGGAGDSATTVAAPSAPAPSGPAGSGSSVRGNGNGNGNAGGNAGGNGNGNGNGRKNDSGGGSGGSSGSSGGSGSKGSSGQSDPDLVRHAGRRRQHLSRHRDGRLRLAFDDAPRSPAQQRPAQPVGIHPPRPAPQPRPPRGCPPCRGAQDGRALGAPPGARGGARGGHHRRQQPLGACRSLPERPRSDRDVSTGADESPVVVRTLQSVVEVIPGFVKGIIAALALALLIASTAWFILARNARFLRRQREKLVGEIGVLQGALLPNVPPELSRLEASVAYRPAEGLAAGGDFYDAFPLDRGQVGIVVGDVAGHGKDALMHTALLRYTMRAYLEAGLEPRGALQVAGRVLDRGFDELATVVLAVYDAERNVLRYATAGHPPPVFLGEADHVPVTRSSSPPIGAMLPTGLRQTTVSLPAGSAACFFTDGLIEARRDGELIGRLGLVEIIRELGPHATAAQLLDRVAQQADYVSDDMAACMFRVADGPAAADAPPRLEELELLQGDPVEPLLEPFLAACGIAPERIARRVATAERTVAAAGGAVVSVSFAPGSPPYVAVDPANVESLAAAQAVRLAI